MHVRPARFATSVTLFLVGLGMLIVTWGTVASTDWTTFGTISSEQQDAIYESLGWNSIIGVSMVWLGLFLLPAVFQPKPASGGSIDVPFIPRP